VAKKLGLTLMSEKTDGERIYRVTAGKPSKSRSKPNISAPPAMAGLDMRAIEGEINRLRSLGLEELRREWRRLYHADAPRISRDLLALALGYRVQEIEHGGLGKVTRRKLRTIAKALRTLPSRDGY
jgi:hypothetical protein